MYGSHTKKYGVTTATYRNSADYGTGKADRNSLDRVSCNPKSLSGKGDLMVVWSRAIAHDCVFSVMEKAWRRRSGRIRQSNLRGRKEKSSC
jgi:hypothetical protein